MVVFVVCIFYIIRTLRNAQKNQTWPPYTANCPDYWVDISGNGTQCNNPRNLGKCDISSVQFADITGSDSSTVLAANCSKYNWATGCGLAWEGITYGYGQYNPCQQKDNQTVS